MAWQDTMVSMLRILVNDMDDTPVYSDSRMEQMLVTAAMYVNIEISFDYTYTIGITTPSISPDPTGNGDDAFTNFVVLKAACITDQSTFRTKALAAGVKAKCGPAVLETLKHLDGFKQLLEIGPCAAYTELKKQWTFGNSRLVHAILSPFTSNNFDPSSLSAISDGYRDGSSYNGLY